MATAIRALVLLVLACFVPAVWLAIEGERAVQNYRTNGGPSLVGLGETIALVALLIVVLIAVTRAGAIAALAIIALVLLALLWSPLSLTGDAH